MLPLEPTRGWRRTLACASALKSRLSAWVSWAVPEQTRLGRHDAGGHLEPPPGPEAESAIEGEERCPADVAVDDPAVAQLFAGVGDERSTDVAFSHALFDSDRTDRTAVSPEEMPPELRVASILREQRPYDPPVLVDGDDRPFEAPVGSEVALPRREVRALEFQQPLTFISGCPPDGDPCRPLDVVGCLVVGE